MLFPPQEPVQIDSLQATSAISRIQLCRVKGQNYFFLSVSFNLKTPADSAVPARTFSPLSRVHWNLFPYGDKESEVAAIERARECRCNDYIQQKRCLNHHSNGLVVWR